MIRGRGRRSLLGLLGLVIGAWPTEPGGLPGAETAARARNPVKALGILEAAAEDEARLVDWGLGNPRKQLEISIKRANTARMLGRHAEAAPLLEAGIAEARLQDEPFLLGRALHYRGRLAYDQARLTEAKALLTEAEAVLAAHPDLPEAMEELDGVRYSLAGVLEQGGDLLGAYQRFAPVLASATARGDKTLENYTLSALAYCLINAHRFDLSLPLLDESMSLAEARGDARYRALIQARRAEVLEDMGRFDEARAAVRDVAEAGGTPQVPDIPNLVVATVGVESRLGSKTVALGRARDLLASGVLDGANQAKANVVLFLAEAIMGGGDDGDGGEPADAVEAEQVLQLLPPTADAQKIGIRVSRLRGRIAEALGRNDEALRFYADVVAAEETHWSEGGLGLLRTMNDRPGVRRPLEHLIRLKLAAGQARDALELIGRAKARAFTWSLLRRAYAPEGAVDDRPRDVRLTEEGVDLASVSALMRRVAPSAAASALPGDLPDLPPGVLALEIYVDGETVHLFLLGSAGPAGPAGQLGGAPLFRHVRSTHPTTEWRAAATALVSRVVRQAPDWTAPADTLGDDLLGPFAEVLESAAAAGHDPPRLVIVPHAFLHGVPFPALRLHGRMLLDILPTWEAASLRLVALSEAGPRGDLQAPGGALVVGDVDLPGQPPLPGAAAEVAAVAGALGASRLTGAAATASAVRAAAPSQKLLHFATHATGDTDAHPSALQLSPEADRPDGRWAAGDIAGLNLSAELVFLSACETGSGAVGGADENWNVLDRAFLLTGAHTVISTRWAVDDAASRALAEAFYAALPSKGRLGALLAAQKAVRAASPGRTGHDAQARGFLPPRSAASDWSHPYFWSGVRLMGDPR